MLPIIGGNSSKKVALEGNFEGGQALAGEAVGLIHDVPTIRKLIDRIVAEAQAIAQRFRQIGIPA